VVVAVCVAVDDDVCDVGARQRFESVLEYIVEISWSCV
jgi:hypothetical protein